MLRATEEWSYVEREVDVRLEQERLEAVSSPEISPRRCAAGR